MSVQHPSILQQIESIQHAKLYIGLKPPKMRLSEIDEQQRRLSAAIKTLEAEWDRQCGAKP